MPVSTFKVGDIVQLKSGGPPMTVYQTNDEDDEAPAWADCSWFDKNQDKRQRFQQTSLKTVKEPESDRQSAYDASVKLFSKGSLSIEDILEMFNIEPEEVKTKLRDEYVVDDTTFNEAVRAIYAKKYAVGKNYVPDEKKDELGFKVEVVTTDSSVERFGARLEAALNAIRAKGYTHLETHLALQAGIAHTALIIYVPVRS